MATAEQIRETCAQWIEAFNIHDSAALAACYAEEGVHYNPIAPEPVSGRKAIADFFDDFFTAFPDSTIEFPRVVVEEGRAAVESVIRGTQQGTLTGGGQSIPPTGRSIEFSGVCMWETDANGKIVSDTVHFNPMLLLQQLGAMQAA